MSRRNGLNSRSTVSYEKGPSKKSILGIIATIFFIWLFGYIFLDLPFGVLILMYLVYFGYAFSYYYILPIMKGEYPYSENDPAVRYRRKNKRKSLSKDEILFTPARNKRSSIVTVSPAIQEEINDRNKEKTEIRKGYVWVSELNKEVQACCYQSARLGDRYCVCGKVVEDDLLKLFHPELFEA